MKNLAGNRCECGACGLRFGSLYAFDHHRVGGWEDRRCLPNTALSELGWKQDSRGFWRTPRKERVDTTPDIDTVEGIDK